MFTIIKFLWRPSTHYVTYCYKFGMDCDNYTKYKYWSFDKAISTMRRLYKMTPEQLKEQEGIDPCPIHFRVVTIVSGNPITRLLNLTGRRQMYRVFGTYI